jgi:hypothetical protein
MARRKSTKITDAIKTIRARKPRTTIKETPATTNILTDVPTPDKKPGLFPAKYREKYAAHDGSTGDVLAVALKKVTSRDGKTDLAALREVAVANGVDLDRWAHLNLGMQRMNLGNRLRGMAKRGIVTIGGATFGEEPQL